MNKSAPTKEDCKMLDAIMKAAKQIHEEFDCLSDHVMTKRQIREQIAQIIWKHVDSRDGRRRTKTHNLGTGRTKSLPVLPQFEKRDCGHLTKACCSVCGNCFACCKRENPPKGRVDESK